jgi:hypothetical protein
MAPARLAAARLRCQRAELEHRAARAALLLQLANRNGSDRFRILLRSRRELAMSPRLTPCPRS